MTALSRILRRRCVPSNRRLLSTQNPAANAGVVGSLACRLASRSVVRFAGQDTIKFLQGLLTNDVRRLDAGIGSPTSYLPTPNLNHQSPPPVYTALLTPQGRFLYDLFLYRPPSSEGKIDQRTGASPARGDSKENFCLLADVDSEVVDELMNCLKKYRLRSKVDIENVVNEFSCWQRFGGDLSSNAACNQEPEAASVGWGTGVDHTGEAAAQGSDQGWQWFKDPRLYSLGYRGIFPANVTPPLVEADKEADERHYLLWRLEKGVPEGSIEIRKGEAIPLEYNLAGLNAISFDKGCYVGQELIARTHHRGVIRKRLVPLRFVDENGEDPQTVVTPDSDIVDYTSSKKVGTVTTALGSQGSGLMRLEEVVKQQSSTLCIKDKENIRVRAIKPDWWPSEWTQLQEQQSVAA